MSIDEVFAALKDGKKVELKRLGLAVGEEVKIDNNGAIAFLSGIAVCNYRGDAYSIIPAAPPEPEYEMWEIKPTFSDTVRLDAVRERENSRPIAKCPGRVDFAGWYWINAATGTQSGPHYASPWDAKGVHATHVRFKVWKNKQTH